MTGRVCSIHNEYCPTGACRWCEPLPEPSATLSAAFSIDPGPYRSWRQYTAQAGGVTIAGPTLQGLWESYQAGLFDNGPEVE